MYCLAPQVISTLVNVQQFGRSFEEMISQQEVNKNNKWAAGFICTLGINGSA